MRVGQGALAQQPRDARHDAELLETALAARPGCKIKAVTDLLDDGEFQGQYGLESFNAADKGKLAIWAACEAGGKTLALALKYGEELARNPALAALLELVIRAVFNNKPFCKEGATMEITSS